MDDNPQDRRILKLFLMEILVITVLFMVLVIISVLISLPPTMKIIFAFFSETNISTTQNFFINQTENPIILNTSIYIDNATNSIIVNSSSYVNSPISGNSFGFDSISSIIAILGFFGVVAFLFNSIKEGSLSKLENRNVYYGFTSSVFVAIFIVGIIVISFLQGQFASTKIFEIAILAIILALTLLIACFFAPIFKGIDGNYQNHVNLKNFLEIQDSNAVISQPLDNFVRLIILHNDFIYTPIFILVCVFPISGFLIGLNLLSVIFIELMILLIYNGFIRLIGLCQTDSNITLRTHLYATNFTCPCGYLLNVFFLPNSDTEYFKILTSTGVATIAKNEITCIHDNEIIVFKGKEKLSPLNIWVKRSIRLVISIFVGGILFYVLFAVLIYIVTVFNPMDIQNLSELYVLIITIGLRILSILIPFCIVSWQRLGFDNRLEQVTDQFIIKPTPLII